MTVQDKAAAARAEAAKAEAEATRQQRAARAQLNTLNLFRGNKHQGRDVRGNDVFRLRFGSDTHGFVHVYDPAFAWRLYGIDAQLESLGHSFTTWDELALALLDAGRVPLDVERLTVDCSSMTTVDDPPPLEWARIPCALCRGTGLHQGSGTECTRCAAEGEVWASFRTLREGKP